jgi:release factor glutamine methyltransferase
MIKHPVLEFIGDVYKPSDDSWMIVNALIETNPMADLCLDLGSGTGVLGLYALLNGYCRRIVFIDVLDDAVYSTRVNIELNSAWMSIVVQSDDYCLREGSMDIVLANPPYLPVFEGGIVDVATEGGLEGYEAVLVFIDYASRVLKRGGLLYIVFSSFSKPDVIHSYLESKGFRVKYSSLKHFFLETLFVLGCINLGGD